MESCEVRRSNSLVNNIVEYFEASNSRKQDGNKSDNETISRRHARGDSRTSASEGEPHVLGTVDASSRGDSASPVASPSQNQSQGQSGPSEHDNSGGEVSHNAFWAEFERRRREDRIQRKERGSEVQKVLEEVRQERLAEALASEGKVVARRSSTSSVTGGSEVQKLLTELRKERQANVAAIVSAPVRGQPAAALVSTTKGTSSSSTSKIRSPKQASAIARVPSPASKRLAQRQAVAPSKATPANIVEGKPKKKAISKRRRRRVPETLGGSPRRGRFRCCEDGEELLAYPAGGWDARTACPPSFDQAAKIFAKRKASSKSPKRRIAIADGQCSLQDKSATSVSVTASQGSKALGRTSPAAASPKKGAAKAGEAKEKGSGSRGGSSPPASPPPKQKAGREDEEEEQQRHSPTPSAMPSPMKGETDTIIDGSAPADSAATEAVPAASGPTHPQYALDADDGGSVRVPPKAEPMPPESIDAAGVESPSGHVNARGSSAEADSRAPRKLSELSEAW